MKSIPAGLLGHRVTIQEKVITRDSYGAEIVTWSNVATLWMQVEPVGSREMVVMRDAMSEATTAFRCRYIKGITTGHRLVWNGQNWNISRLIDMEASGAVLEMQAYAEAVET